MKVIILAVTIFILAFFANISNAQDGGDPLKILPIPQCYARTMCPNGTMLYCQAGGTGYFPCVWRVRPGAMVYCEGFGDMGEWISVTKCCGAQCY